MADHDQRFKNLLQEFFADFVQLFFPEWADRFDFSKLEWLNAEAFSDPPQGERRYLDLVAKLPTRQVVPAMRPGEEDAWIAVLHVEIEWPDGVAPARPRLFDYYWMLRARHHCPVLPIGLYLRVGLDGVGWDVFEEFFWERRLVHFEYPYVGLPALDAEHYVNGDNWLGVALAAQMRIAPERRAWLKAEALRKLVGCPENPMRRYLLCEVVQAYLPLEGPQLEEFNHLLITEKYAEVLPMATTWFEEGLEKGRAMAATQLEEALEKGRVLGQRRTLQKLLEKRFGSLDRQILVKLELLSGERLEELSLDLLDARSLDELGLEADRPA
jgi:Domain of unknown function (DUF4351)